MSRLWRRMKKTYPTLWVKREGPTPSLEWEQALEGLDKEQFAKGLEGMYHRHDTFPPNYMQFRKLCLGEYLDDEGNEVGKEHKTKVHICFDDPRHPDYEHYRKKKQLSLESDSHKTKHRAAGNAALKDILGGL